MKLVQNLSVRRLVILAIFIRLLVIPFLFHPDIKTYNFQSSFLKQGEFNIYEYLTENKEELQIKEEFVYYPLTYIFLGSYQKLVSPFLGSNFNSWFTQSMPMNIYRYLLLLKLPYLAIDIAIAFLLKEYFDNKKQKDRVFFLWLINPFTIIILYAFSNVDVLPVLFTVIALLSLKRNRGLYVGIALALGAGFKAYPLLLLPTLLLTKEKLSKQIVNILLSVLLLAVIIAPFWGKSFIQSAFSSGLTNRLFDFGINVGLPKKLPYYLIIYVAGFIYTYFKRRENVWSFYLLSTLLLVASVNFHIQWMLWPMPFLAIAIVKNYKLALNIFLLLTVGVLVPLLANDRYLTSSLYAPVSDIFNQTSYIYIFLLKYIDPIRVQSVLGYVFIALSLILMIRIYKYEKS